MMTLVLRNYAVQLRGRDIQTHLAASRSRAKAAAFSLMHEVWGIPFRSFIGLVESVRLIDMPPGVGRPILVLGKPAFFISRNSQYVQIAYPGSDQVLNAHPSDVVEVGS